VCENGSKLKGKRAFSKSSIEEIRETALIAIVIPALAEMLAANYFSECRSLAWVTFVSW
jgi:hypothetical protein